MSYEAPYCRRDIESAIFHHMATSRAFIKRVAAELTVDDFGNKDYQAAFEKLHSAYARGMDLTTEQRCVDLIGQSSGMTAFELMESQDAAMDAIKLQSLRRKLDKACRSLRHIIDDPTVDFSELRQSLDHYREDVIVNHSADTIDCGSRATIARYVTECERSMSAGPQAIPTGIHVLDDHMRICPGDLVILAARPGMGKTSCAITWTSNQINDKLATPGFLTLEMPHKQIMDKIISSMSAIPFSSVERMEMAVHELSTHTEAIERYANSGAQLYQPKRRMSVGEIRDFAKEWVQSHNIDILYIDQLSKIAHANKFSLREQLSDSVGAMKELALELSIPIVLLVQLNRSANEEGVPQLNHIKETSSIEEDADIVLMPWRADSEGEVDAEKTFGINGRKVHPGGKVFFLCRKYRNGKPFQQVTDWDGETMTMGRARV